MGVKGLWQLLLPIGRRISIETLEGHVLAVDASIWLTQFLKAMRDQETGKAQPAAHLKGFFRRLCRLLFHNIKPVFVFDGATPEVKAAELALRRRRREQFAHMSQDAMHRMAKKLLHENLLKQRIHIENQGNTEAFERGFNPGDTTEDIASSEKKTAQAVDSVSQEDLNINNILVEESLNEETACRKQTESESDQRRVNDWDDPPESEKAQLLRLGLYDSDDHSDDNESIENFHYDMSFLTSLPPNRRKDAIEKAQRRHRIKSRQEHMPAAGDPFAFSQVQLSNFLKSSRLNKSIQASLAAAVKHDTHGGDVMASDTTTRLVLLREDNHNDHKRLRRKRKIKDSDSEEEPDWESPASTRNKIVINKSLTEIKPFVGNHLPRPQGTKTIKIDDSNDDAPIQTVDESDREFLASTKNDLQDCRRLYLDENHADCSSTEDEIEEGGFLTDSAMDKNHDVISAETGLVQVGSAGEAADQVCYSDTAHSQEMQDSLLAAALQKMECEEDQMLSDVRKSDSDRLDEPDDESIVWEDGDTADFVGEVSKQSDLLLNAEKCSMNKAMERDAWTEDSFDREELSLETKRSERKNRMNGSVQSVEATAALERAEKEAAKLADWAGRVFRRAMKDAVMVTGKSEADKPIVNEDEFDHLQEFAHKSDSRTVSEQLRKSSKTGLAFGANADTQQRENASIQGREKADIQGREYAPFDPPIQAKSSNNKVASTRTAAEEDVEAQKTKINRALEVVEEKSTQWAEERNRRERDMDSVTDEMKLEVMHLLELFGVPYLEAPAEAEAQCVELERLGLVDGIITEDSDVFVFGGQAVYKNIFEDQKFAEAYKAADAEREMGLGKNEMVALAMLLGGDYTSGVKGVGIVNAMEIIQAFNFSECARNGLRQFKDWLDGVNLPDANDFPEGFTACAALQTFHMKHRTARNRWVAPENFPNPIPLQAYTHPVVDSSKERFSWGKPDLAGLLVFCNQHIGWSTDETKTLLGPVTERPISGMRQTRLDAYMPMRYEDSITFAKVRSKRLQKVLRKRKENDGAKKEDA